MRTHFAFDNIALVTVTYESERLAGFFAETGQLFRHVYVVDNHSSDGTVAAFQQQLPHAHVLTQSKNLGFGPANNVGFRAASADCAWVLFLNPDCQISEASVRQLLQTLADHHHAVIACPVVVDAQGQDHGVRQRDYRLGYQHEVVDTIPLTPDMPTYLAHTCVDGACLLVDRHKFAAMGAFNPDLFMYCEEDDVSLRALAHGYSVVTHTHARAVHLGGASSPATFRILLRKAYHGRWSRLYMMGTYINPGLRTREAMKTLLTAPVALLVYGVLWRRRHFIKWMGWLQASFTTLLGR